MVGIVYSRHAKWVPHASRNLRLWLHVRIQFLPVSFPVFVSFFESISLLLSGFNLQLAKDNYKLMSLRRCMGRKSLHVGQAQKLQNVFLQAQQLFTFLTNSPIEIFSTKGLAICFISITVPIKILECTTAYLWFLMEFLSSVPSSTLLYVQLHCIHSARYTDRFHWLIAVGYFRGD